MPQEDQRKNEKFLKKIRRKMESLLQKFQIDTMENLQKMTKQTDETILQSVGLPLQGISTTYPKTKEDTEDKHSRMNQKSPLWKKDDHTGKPKQQRKRDESERY